MKSKLLIGTFAALLTAAVGCDRNRGSGAQTTPSSSAGYTAQAQQPLPPVYQTDPNLTQQSGGATGDGSMSDPNTPSTQRPMGGTDVGNGADTSGSNGQRNSTDMTNPVPPPDTDPTGTDTGTGTQMGDPNTGTGTSTSPGTPGTGTNPGTPIVPPTGSGPGTGTGTGTQPGTGPGTGAPTGGSGGGAG